MEIRNSTFRDTIVQLDGQRFVGCHFERCVFEIDGRGSIELVDCNVVEPRGFRFAGHFAAGLEILRDISHRMGPKGVKRTVDGISALLRKPNPVETFVIE